MAILLGQPPVGEFGLRVLVEELHVGVSGRGVEVKIILLDVLAVIAFAAGETEKTLLEDWIFPVPKGEGEANVLVAIRNAPDAVFPPAIGAAARMVVGQVLPSGAVEAIILADRTPLALGEVGSPALPIRFVLAILFQSNFFFSHALLSLLFFRRFYFIIPSIHDGGLFETISKVAAPTLR